MGDAAVWWATVRPVDPGLLDGDVLTRLRAMRSPADRARHATGALLCDLVARRCGDPEVRVVRRRGAAPQVVGTHLHLSVSHTGNHVGVAVASRPVGLDVERVRPLDVEALAAAALSPAERDRLARDAVTLDGRAFLTIWVRKEAVLKAAGTGLAVDPRRLEVSPPSAAAGLLRADGLPHPARCWDLRDLAGPPGAVCALASLGPLADVRRCDGDRLLELARATSGRVQRPA